MKNIFLNFHSFIKRSQFPRIKEFIFVDKIFNQPNIKNWKTFFLSCQTHFETWLDVTSILITGST